MPRPALSQLWGSYTAAEMPRSFSSHTSPRDVLMVVVDSRTLVKDSARLSLRGVHGVATGVDFKWLALPQAGVGAELRLGVTRVSSSEGCRMRQVVKVKVELVCDMHFPGWWACKLDLGEEGETRMFWVEGGPSKTTTLLSTGMQSIEFQLPTQSRQGFPSAFFGQ